MTWHASKQVTSPPWNSRRQVHSKEMVWASPCAHSIGKFFLCYIVLFSSETSAPGSPGNYLYYTRLSPVNGCFFGNPMESSPKNDRTYMKLLTDQVSFRPINMCTGCAKHFAGKICFFVRKAQQLSAMLSLGHQRGTLCFRSPILCASRGIREELSYMWFDRFGPHERRVISWHLGTIWHQQNFYVEEIYVLVGGQIVRMIQV